MPREITTRTEKQTLIEQGTEFKGTMKSTCPVIVHGRVEGELTAPELDVTATGVVQGNIKAERLSSRGTLSGNVDAGDLFLSGAIGSKTVIKARNLEVKLAPDQGRMELTIGECTLDVGDEPTRERRLEPNKSATPAASASHLPVTRSEAPTGQPPKEDKPEVTLVASSNPAETKDGTKSARTAAGGLSGSKKGTGTSDSVPPPPPGT